MTKIKKILFIIPLHIPFEDYINPPSNARSIMKNDGKYYNSIMTDLPLGAMSMSAYIKKFHSGIDVKLLDFNVEINLFDDGFPYENFYKFVHDHLSKINFSPDVVAISSLFSPSFNNFIDCGKSSKEIFPKSLVIGGGNIPTNSYEYIYDELKHEFFDALCFGEGEKPMVELIEAENANKYLENSTSWITPKKLRMFKGAVTPTHNFVDDLDDIPFFDYDLCDYNTHGLNPVMSAFSSFSDQTGFHIMTSRGCPFMCTFCASHKVHGRDMRYHSLERVRKDAKKLKDKYGATTLIFQDDHLMGDPERVYEILKIIKELKVQAIFQNGLTLYALNHHMLSAFYDAGIDQLVLPVESGSEKVLKKQMKKPLKTKISEQVARDCREIGIYTDANVLVGMPGETKEDIDEARIKLRGLNANWYHVVCASPIVGSEMHELALENNYISGDTLGADYRKAVIDTEDFSAEYIQRIQYAMNLELNFVYNSDIKLGHYELALKGLKNVVRVRSDHAFGHYYMSMCYFYLKDFTNAKKHLSSYIDLVDNVFWRKYINLYNLPILEKQSLDNITSNTFSTQNYDELIAV
ncbi:radical SAM protein [Methylophilaceae bacterium]|nr:radical SAM protein [Methylophilaceae bacterium]|tara:strand:+ start:1622 stop:3358 length:1737 start_codon:yes stop_codon:yes gene_type:complete